MSIFSAVLLILGVQIAWNGFRGLCGKRVSLKNLPTVQAVELNPSREVKPPTFFQSLPFVLPETYLAIGVSVTLVWMRTNQEQILRTLLQYQYELFGYPDNSVASMLFIDGLILILVLLLLTTIIVSSWSRKLIKTTWAGRSVELAAISGTIAAAVFPKIKIKKTAKGKFLYAAGNILFIGTALVALFNLKLAILPLIVSFVVLVLYQRERISRAQRIALACAYIEKYLPEAPLLEHFDRWQHWRRALSTAGFLFFLLIAKVLYPVYVFNDDSISVQSIYSKSTINYSDIGVIRLGTRLLANEDGTATCTQVFSLEGESISFGPNFLELTADEGRLKATMTLLLQKDIALEYQEECTDPKSNYHQDSLGTIRRAKDLLESISST